MFKTRLISGIALLIVLATALWCGNWLLWGLLLVISLMGVRELYQAVGFGNASLDNKRMDAMALAGYFFTIVLYGVLKFHCSESVILPVVLAALVVMMCLYVFMFPKYQPVDLFCAIFAVLYVPVMLSYVYLIREQEQGLFTVWLVFVCSWICDTCAYCVGVTLGRHKLAPVLSPKKSIEGAVGGVVGSAIVGALYGFVIFKVDAALMGANAIWAFAVVGAVGAGVSQIGDLTASAIKRHYGVKDYGTLIPGHGGILDRFDSVIVIAPVIYLILKFI